MCQPHTGSWDARKVEDETPDLGDLSPGREESRGGKEQAGRASVQYLVWCGPQPP